jgi:hypothetical protein
MKPSATSSGLRPSPALQFGKRLADEPAQSACLSRLMRVDGVGRFDQIGQSRVLVVADEHIKRSRLCLHFPHYRQPINWTEAGLREAKRTLDHWHALTADIAPGFFCADMLDVLADDLNTPRAPCRSSRVTHRGRARSQRGGSLPQSKRPGDRLAPAFRSRLVGMATAVAFDRRRANRRLHRRT